MTERKSPQIREPSPSIATFSSLVPTCTSQSRQHCLTHELVEETDLDEQSNGDFDAQRSIAETILSSNPSHVDHTERTIHRVDEAKKLYDMLQTETHMSYALITHALLVNTGDVTLAKQYLTGITNNGNRWTELGMILYRTAQNVVSLTP